MTYNEQFKPAASGVGTIGVSLDPARGVITVTCASKQGVRKVASQLADPRMAEDELDGVMVDLLNHWARRL